MTYCDMSQMLIGCI